MKGKGWDLAQNINYLGVPHIADKCEEKRGGVDEISFDSPLYELAFVAHKVVQVKFFVWSLVVHMSQS